MIDRYFNSKPLMVVMFILGICWILIACSNKTTDPEPREIQTERHPEAKGCSSSSQTCSCKVSNCRESDNPCCQCSALGCQCKCNGCAGEGAGDGGSTLRVGTVTQTETQKQFSHNLEAFVRGLGSSAAIQLSQDIAQQRNLIQQQDFEGYYTLTMKTRDDYQALSATEQDQLKTWLEAHVN